jgi:phosphate butyryltransferase
MEKFKDIISLADTIESRHRTIAVAGADDDAVMGAVAAGIRQGIGFILIGNPDRIRAAGDESGVSLDGVDIRSAESGDAQDENGYCRTAARLCAEGRAGVMMKGRLGTAAFTRAILDKQIGLTEKGALLSHVGLFSDPRNGRSFLVTDAAINISPDLEAKKRILANAVKVARALGADVPRIALLAPVEKVNPKIASTMDAAALKDWVAQGGLGKAVADGPFALDAAASEEAAAVKGISDNVAGRADIFLAPNLDTGNVLYKSLSVFAGASSAGILAGAKVPVVLTSRSDSDETKWASVALALRIAAYYGATS